MSFPATQNHLSVKLALPAFNRITKLPIKSLFKDEVKLSCTFKSGIKHTDSRLSTWCTVLSTHDELAWNVYLGTVPLTVPSGLASFSLSVGELFFPVLLRHHFVALEGAFGEVESKRFGFVLHLMLKLNCLGYDVHV